MRLILALALLALATPAHAWQVTCLDGFASRYIREAERNLSRSFAIAEQSDVALNFDEADALFEGRTQVRTGHDRTDLAPVDHLIARLERYEGLVHLASNRRTMIAGFDRRSRNAGIIVIETETGARSIEFTRADRPRALAYAEATLDACPAR